MAFPFNADSLQRSTHRTIRAPIVLASIMRSPMAHSPHFSPCIHQRWLVCLESSLFTFPNHFVYNHRSRAPCRQLNYSRSLRCRSHSFLSLRTLTVGLNWLWPYTVVAIMVYPLTATLWTYVRNSTQAQTLLISPLSLWPKSRIYPRNTLLL